MVTTKHSFIDTCITIVTCYVVESPLQELVSIFSVRRTKMQLFASLLVLSAIVLGFCNGQRQGAFNLFSRRNYLPQLRVPFTTPPRRQRFFTTRTPQAQFQPFEPSSNFRAALQQDLRNSQTLLQPFTLHTNRMFDNNKRNVTLRQTNGKPEHRELVSFVNRYDLQMTPYDVHLRNGRTSIDNNSLLPSASKFHSPELRIETPTGQTAQLRSAAASRNVQNSVPGTLHRNPASSSKSSQSITSEVDTQSVDGNMDPLTGLQVDSSPSNGVTFVGQRSNQPLLYDSTILRRFGLGRQRQLPSNSLEVSPRSRRGFLPRVLSLSTSGKRMSRIGRPNMVISATAMDPIKREFWWLSDNGNKSVATHTDVVGTSEFVGTGSVKKTKLIEPIHQSKSDQSSDMIESVNHGDIYQPSDEVAFVEGLIPPINLTFIRELRDKSRTLTSHKHGVNLRESIQAKPSQTSSKDIFSLGTIKIPAYTDDMKNKVYNIRGLGKVAQTPTEYKTIDIGLPVDYMGHGIAHKPQNAYYSRNTSPSQVALTTKLENEITSRIWRRSRRDQTKPIPLSQEVFSNTKKPEYTTNQLIQNNHHQTSMGRYIPGIYRSFKGPATKLPTNSPRKISFIPLTYTTTFKWPVNTGSSMFNSDNIPRPSQIRIDRGFTSTAKNPLFPGQMPRLTPTVLYRDIDPKTPRSRYGVTKTAITNTRNLSSTPGQSGIHTSTSDPSLHWTTPDRPLMRHSGTTTENPISLLAKIKHVKMQLATMDNVLPEYVRSAFGDKTLDKYFSVMEELPTIGDWIWKASVLNRFAKDPKAIRKLGLTDNRMNRTRTSIGDLITSSRHLNRTGSRSYPSYYTSRELFTRTVK